MSSLVTLTQATSLALTLTLTSVYFAVEVKRLSGRAEFQFHPDRLCGLGRLA